MSRICYVSRNYKSLDGAGNKAKTDNEDTLELMGAYNLGLRRTLSRNKVLSFFLGILGVLKYCILVRKNDVVLLQYPIKKYGSSGFSMS